MTLARSSLRTVQDVRLPAGAWTAAAGLMVLDFPDRTLLIRGSQVIGALPTGGLLLIGLDEVGELAVFSEADSWHYRVYDLRQRAWLETADPLFPRFTLEEEQEGAVLMDLETGRLYRLTDLPPAEIRAA